MMSGSIQTWQARQEPLARAYELLAARQNRLGLAAALRAAIQDNELRRIIATVGLIGGVDQWSDSTDLKDAQFRAEIRRFYG